MRITVEQETFSATGGRYKDFFVRVDLRRTIITCSVCGIQILSGTGLRVYSTYFYQQAGLPTTQAFNMSMIQYALGIVGVVIAWFLLPHFGRRTLYLYGLAGLATCLVIIGGLGTMSHNKKAIAWTIGSMLIAYRVVYDITVGPICYALVSEMPSSQLRSKTIALARITDNVLNIISNVITPFMLNPPAWGGGAKAGFFFARTCTLSLVFTAIFIPETKNRNFAELNQLLSRGTEAWKFSTEKVDLEGTKRRDDTES